jgi:acyl carrier protein
MSVDTKSIVDKVFEVVADSLKIDRQLVTLEANIYTDLNADSLDSTELMIALENAFGCQIPDEDTDKIKTVGDIVTYVTAHGQAQANRS